MTMPFSAPLSDEQLASLHEDRAKMDRIVADADDRRSDAQIIADEQAKKRAQMADFERRIAPQLDACDVCGKSRSVEILPARYRGRFDEIVSPQKYCACAGGPVKNPDAWEVEFARGHRDAACPVLRPSLRAYAPTSLVPQIAPGDTEPLGPSSFIPANRAFEWGEESPACRRLAYTMLALVTNTTTADRWAEAYMREVLATTIAKNAGRKQAQTLGEIRAWLLAHEASAGAAA